MMNYQIGNGFNSLLSHPEACLNVALITTSYLQKSELILTLKTVFEIHVIGRDK